ncbi:MAG: rRNA maturation RNase YbeY [Patescibacteria group bacterium]|jgi:rRNA maturation RNase YbeY|nr:rRNA maturation RNase YbeY [Patescibacteria group bacterium]
MKIEFNNIADFESMNGIEPTIRLIIEDIQSELQKEGVISAKTEYEISVASVKKEEIRKLNFEYRKKDEPTDILSFGYEITNEVIQGELIFCPEVIWANAIEDGITSMEELLKNLVHGFLHISGHEHGEDMFEIQALVLSILLPKYIGEIT